MSLSLTENVIVIGADDLLNGPFQYGTIVEPRNETTPAMVRARTYTDLTGEEKIRESVDIKYYPQLSSATQQYHSPPTPQHSYDAPMVQQSQYLPQNVTQSLVVHQQPYQAPVLQQSYQAQAIQQPS
ncbi:hypothetical protein Tco_1381642 [Tanacetum coccineum]